MLSPARHAAGLLLRCGLILRSPAAGAGGIADTGIETWRRCLSSSGSSPVIAEAIRRKRQQEQEQLKAASNPWTSRARIFTAICGLGISLAYLDFLISDPTVTDKVYLDLAVGNQPPRRVVLGLYGRVNQRTVQNFVALADHSYGSMGFRGSPIHCAVRGFAIFGGDFTKGDGTGGASIFGPTFRSENLRIFPRKGCVCMVVDEEQQVRSQFYITLMPLPKAYKSTVVFGRVLEGLDVVEDISNLPVDRALRPLEHVRIADCGSLPTHGAQSSPGPNVLVLNSGAFNSGPGAGAGASTQHSGQ